MSETNVVKLEDHKIDPIRPSGFGVAEHQYRRFNARVPQGVTLEKLTDPALWVHVGKQLQAEDEIRVIADDSSFVATLFVHYANGSDVRVGVLNCTDFGAASLNVEIKDNSRYEVVLMGKKKFVVREKSTLDIKIEGIASKSEAFKQMEELERALRS